MTLLLVRFPCTKQRGLRRHPTLHLRQVLRDKGHGLREVGVVGTLPRA